MSLETKVEKILSNDDLQQLYKVMLTSYMAVIKEHVKLRKYHHELILLYNSMALASLNNLNPDNIKELSDDLLI